MVRLKRFAAKTNQGPYLQVNEDTIHADTVNNLYLLIDGIGGSQIGDETARLAREVVKNFYAKGNSDPDATLPFYFDPKNLVEVNVLRNAIIYAHKKILEQNKDKKVEDRGAASIIAVAKANGILSVASVGNCIGKLFRHGKLETFMLPNSFCFYGKGGHQKQFYCTPLSAIGMYEQIDLEIREIGLSDGDEVLLMSDGVYSRIDDSEIASILLRDSDLIENKIDELFKLANIKGNLDNQSAILLKF